MVRRLFQYQIVTAPVPPPEPAVAIEASWWLPQTEQPHRNYAFRKLTSIALIAAIPFFFFQNPPELVAAPVVLQPELQLIPRVKDLRYTYPTFFYQFISEAAVEPPTVISEISQPLRIFPKLYYLYPTFFYQQEVLQAAEVRIPLEQINQPYFKKLDRSNLYPTLFFQQEVLDATISSSLLTAISQPSYKVPYRIHQYPYLFFDKVPEPVIVGIFLPELISQPQRRILNYPYYLGQSVFAPEYIPSGVLLEDSIIGTIQGTRTIDLSLGKTFRIQAAGFYSTAILPDTLNIKLKLGSTEFLMTGVRALPVNVTNGLWKLDCLFTCRSVGVTGSVIGQSLFERDVLALDNTIFSQTVNVTVVNTINQLTLLGSGIGTVTLPANFFVIGKVIRLKAYGVYSSQNSIDAIAIRTKLGSTIVGTTGNFNLDAISNNSNRYWELEYIFTCRTTGVTGTIMGDGRFLHDTNTFSGNIIGMMNTAVTTINTTISQVIDLTADWVTANVVNSITCQIVTLETLESVIDSVWWKMLTISPVTIDTTVSQLVDLRAAFGSVVPGNSISCTNFSLEALN